MKNKLIRISLFRHYTSRAAHESEYERDAIGTELHCPTLSLTESQNSSGLIVAAPLLIGETAILHCWDLQGKSPNLPPYRL
jgi:hypothetical protein